MFGIRLGRILGVAIALIGLSVFLASRFGPSSVGAGRGEPTATGFTMVSQQFLKQDDGPRLLMDRGCSKESGRVTSDQTERSGKITPE